MCRTILREVISFLVLFLGVILTAFGKAIIMMDLTMRIADSVQALADLLPLYQKEPWQIMILPLQFK